MPMLTPGIRSAREMLADPAPAWLETWSAFAAGCSFSDLSEEVVARTRLVLLDCLGAIMAGHAEPEMRALVAHLAEREGDGRAACPGAERTLTPLAAAFASGTAGTMLELDEGNQFARGHPGIHVVPAALIAAEREGASGEALLLAIALGYEIGARIGMASRLRVTMHPHGTWGTVGAALACAKLAGASADEIANTINIGANLGLSTSRRTMLEGASARNSYAGFSNQLGTMAFDLASAGFLGERDGVGAVYGGIIAEDFSPAVMTEELGTRWEIARNYFKRHAACRYTHGALDAVALLSAEAKGKLAPEAISAIEVDTYVWAAQLDHPSPATMLAAKFSLPFAIATAIVNGHTGLDAFRDAARADVRVLDLARRVAVREDAAFDAMLPGLRPARVTVRLADGTTLAREVLTNRGDTEDPYSAGEVREKFRDLADPVVGAERARRIMAAIDTLGPEPISSLGDLLRAAPPQQSGEAA